MTKARDNASNPDTVLASGTFSAVTAVNFTGLLTDSYKFYELTFHVYGSAVTDINLRFRQDSTDRTTGYYAGGNYGSYAGSTGSAYNRNNGSGFGLCTSYGGTTPSAARVTIYRPNANIGMMSMQSWENANSLGMHSSGLADGYTNLNGFSLFPGSGTMTGSYLLIGKKA